MQFVEALGAHVHLMALDEHDALVAYLSHLPQLAASALMHLVGERTGEEGLALAGRGLSDTTRLAIEPAGHLARHRRHERGQHLACDRRADRAAAAAEAWRARQRRCARPHVRVRRAWKRCSNGQEGRMTERSVMGARTYLEMHDPGAADACAAPGRRLAHRSRARLPAGVLAVSVHRGRAAIITGSIGCRGRPRTFAPISTIRT